MEYAVTETEFEQASPKSIKKAYKGFGRLRGKSIKTYEH